MDNYVRYARFLPGGRQYVDGIFDEIARNRKKHPDDVYDIVRRTYEEVQKVVISKSAWSITSMPGKVQSSIARMYARLLSLKRDA